MQRLVQTEPSFPFRAALTHALAQGIRAQETPRHDTVAQHNTVTGNNLFQARSALDSCSCHVQCITTVQHQWPLPVGSPYNTAGQNPRPVANWSMP